MTEPDGEQIEDVELPYEDEPGDAPDEPEPDSGGPAGIVPEDAPDTEEQDELDDVDDGDTEEAG